MDENKLKEIIEEVVNKAVEPIKETLQGHTGALMRIESVLEGYADAYKVNKKNIERLDERLASAEDQLNIQPSDQLAIQR